MPKKIVLAYSGGLDTSVILKWLQVKYQCPVVTFTADLGQGEELSPVKGKAQSLGVEEIFIEDLREEFVKDYVYPMFRANALYEGIYFLGTAIARPLIAKKQIEIAKEVEADTVAHGATGKGNDQVRFELGYYSQNPNIKVVSPWREWELQSRNDLINFAEKYQIHIPKDKRGDAPFSTDANLLHTSSEGKVLEDPWVDVPEYVYSRTKSLENANSTPDEIIISFVKGDAVAINQKNLKAHGLLSKLNEYGCNHGIGREDIVENRFVGMKSRGVYETPGGTLLIHAHRAIESVTLDKETMHKKDNIMSRYAELIYNGYWYSKERFKLQKIIDLKKNKVNGSVKIKLYKGNITIQSRVTNSTAYSMKKVSFEENKSFNKSNVEKFINFHKKKLRN